MSEASEGALICEILNVCMAYQTTEKKPFIIPHYCYLVNFDTIVRFMQLCSKFLPTALLNFACDG